MDWTPANPSKSWDGGPWALGAGAGETCSMGIRVQLDWLCTDSLALRIMLKILAIHLLMFPGSAKFFTFI